MRDRISQQLGQFFGRIGPSRALGRVVAALGLMLGAIGSAQAHDMGFVGRSCKVPFAACTGALQTTIDDYRRAGFAHRPGFTRTGNTVVFNDVNGTDVHIWLVCAPDFDAALFFSVAETTPHEQHNFFVEQLRRVFAQRSGADCTRP